MALAATRAFGRTGVPVAVMAEEAWAPAWASRYCSQRVAAPDADRGESYLDFLAELVTAHAFSGLFFCDDRSIRMVGQQRRRFEPHVAVLLPDQQTLELTCDKAAMLAHAVAHGVAVPRTVAPNGTDEVIPRTHDLRFPLVVKGSGGFASSELRIVHTPQAARRAYDELDELRRRRGEGSAPQLQEWICGSVFSVLALCDRGTPVAMFQMEKRLTYPVWGGPCVDAHSVVDGDLELAARDVLALLPWHGVIEIEFIRDERDGRFLLVEPSPDPNWGLDLAISAGMNIPVLAWRLMQGDRRGAAQRNYRVGKRQVWLMPEGLLHVRERPRSMAPLLGGLLNPNVACDARDTDWRPTVAQLRQTTWAWRADRGTTRIPAPQASGKPRDTMES